MGNSCDVALSQDEWPVKRYQQCTAVMDTLKCATLVHVRRRRQEVDTHRATCCKLLHAESFKFTCPRMAARCRKLGQVANDTSVLLECSIVYLAVLTVDVVCEQNLDARRAREKWLSTSQRRTDNKRSSYYQATDWHR